MQRILRKMLISILVSLKIDLKFSYLGSFGHTFIDSEVIKESNTETFFDMFATIQQSFIKDI